MAGESRKATEVSEATQEVRLATTMTGGVSLAIWMGGVARELNLLMQASRWRKQLKAVHDLPEVATGDNTDAVRRLYLRLLDMLDLTVDVDVLSGTSAGGVNAALLAYCRVKGKDLRKLRNLWLDIGGLLSLLRSPKDKVIPSLLQGDAMMLTQLAQQIPRLADGPRGSAADPQDPTTLFITTTLLSGETGRFSDSYGTLVKDVDFHGLFRFTEAQLSAPEAPAALALAGRCSASFPAAFEPSFVPVGKPVLKAVGQVLPRPDMAQYCDLTRSHWAADGGVLDNQPIGALLQTVFDRPAERQVRRVLLYIVPTTDSPDELADQGTDTPAPADDPARPLGLIRGLVGDVTAVRNQSIAADLRAIAEHNDRIAVRTDARLQLATLASNLADGKQLLTESLLEDYAQREADAIAQPLVAAIMRALTTWTTAGNPSIPNAWADALLPGNPLERQCRAKVVNDLRSEWSTLPNSFATLAAFGRPGYDGGKAVALSIIRAGYEAATTRHERITLARLGRRIHDSFKAPTRIELRRQVNDWLHQAADTGGTSVVLPDVARDLAGRYLRGLASSGDADVPDEAAATPIAEAWRKLARVLVYGRAVLLKTLASESYPLRVYLDYLGYTSGTAVVATRLFDLFATQRAMQPVDADVEQPVELVQVSADTRTSLDPSRGRAARKLTGLQMHHFGAFFKESWRANDWMWGRIDGAGWLVHVLLDPRRIRQLALEQRAPGESCAQWLLDQLTAIGVPAPPDETAGGTPLDVRGSDDREPVLLSLQTLRTELAFLDNAEPPPSLPLTALWVSRAAQLRIAADELPTLARAVAEPMNAGTQSRPKDEHLSAHERAWSRRVPEQPSPSLAESLLRDCPIADQTLSGEQGTPLMVRTVAKVAAVASGALESVEQLPGVVRPVTSWIRTTTLAGWRLTQPLKARPRWMIVGGLIAVLVGFALAIQQETVIALSGLAVLGVGAYLIVFGAWQVSLRGLVAGLSTTVVLGLAALTCPVVRRGLFGTSKKDVGVVGRQVPWLGSDWWHPLAVVGVLAVLVTLVGIASGRRKRGWLREVWKKVTAKLRKRRGNSSGANAPARAGISAAQPLGSDSEPGGALR